jgi:putative SOS response-associated peptidase YedK
MEKIHNRMPVILPKDEEEVWFDQTTSQNELMVLFKSYLAKEMDAYAVSTVVNRAGVESPDLIKPVEASFTMRSQLFAR